MRGKGLGHRVENLVTRPPFRYQAFYSIKSSMTSERLTRFSCGFLWKWWSEFLAALLLNSILEQQKSEVILWKFFNQIFSVLITKGFYEKFCVQHFVLQLCKPKSVSVSVFISTWIFHRNTQFGVYFLKEFSNLIVNWLRGTSTGVEKFEFLKISRENPKNSSFGFFSFYDFRFRFHLKFVGLAFGEWRTMCVCVVCAAEAEEAEDWLETSTCA